MKKLKKLLLTSCLLLLIIIPSYAETLTKLETSPENDYGIVSEKLYPGCIIIKIFKEAEKENDIAIEEAYAAGYKAGLLKSAPETSYWKKKSEDWEDECRIKESENLKLKNARYIYGAGGFLIGIVLDNLFGLALPLQKE